MSKTSIQKLKKNLKPLSQQNKFERRKDKDDESYITGEELLKIYEEKNKSKKKKRTKFIPK